ncbi:MAG: DUF4202 domain-containing protein [bacterium]|nr:DUF4202 domain-containing protein [bacterium]
MSEATVNHERLAAAHEKFDAANAEDPNETQLPDGSTQPKELIYGQRMTEELLRFAPDAPESVHLAARCQHIRRWKIPRKDYPMDKAGYHKWRTILYKFHADQAAEILTEVGYDPETIDRVAFLLQKKKLRSDADTQTLEDVICLTFLRHYFVDFADQHPEEKVVDIVRKTWGKMSEAGHAAALKLDLAPESLRLVQLALA